MIKRCGLLVFLLFLLTACTSYEALAPVSDVGVKRQGHYLVCEVQPGETVYSIAWQYERDYRAIVVLNHLRAPYRIYPGQTIRLADLKHRVKVPRTKTKPIQSVQRYASSTTQAVRHWRWPVKGKVIKTFSMENRGIDIGGYRNESIRAAASGRVVYAGNGIRGYGNLLIIKHNTEYLTAYAYNRKLFVKAGQFVKQGQKIAAMGANDAGRVMLHFEIRRRGKPINPVYYL